MLAMKNFTANLSPSNTVAGDAPLLLPDDQVPIVAYRILLDLDRISIAFIGREYKHKFVYDLAILNRWPNPYRL